MPIALTGESLLKAQHCQLAQLFSTLYSSSSEGSLLHGVHHSQGMMDAFFSAF